MLSSLKNRIRFVATAVVAGGVLAFTPLSAKAQTTEELQQRVTELESQLQDAQTKLQQAEARSEEQATELEDVQAKVAEADSLLPRKIKIGNLTVGGAIRANYVIGDYDNPNPSRPSRGGDGGNFELDTFRINLDYSYENWLGKAEYRFYNGYNFLHTGWVGYQFDEESHIQLGVNRVPFGPGPYGVSQSWFFDQHYYVGLSDDMDLGLKYIKKMDNLTFDLAYYISDEGQWRGDSQDSARYSYDVVDETDLGYEERNQVNARAIYKIDNETVPTELGLSLQYGQLDSNGSQDDGDHYAASVHMVNQWKSWKLASQLTYYKYEIDDYTVQSGAFTDDLVDMGAYDYAYPVAAEAYIPAVSLSYYYEAAKIAWLDSVTPYLEYSSIVKADGDHNDSELLTLGAAWARNGWYIYTDLAYSNGNYFVGGDEFTNFGANPDDEWQTRFNINFGYYF
ncbi:MAG: hypothetical protein R6V56_01100 [Lentisphaeria bacterium]